MWEDCGPGVLEVHGSWRSLAHLRPTSRGRTSPPPPLPTPGAPRVVLGEQRLKRSGDAGELSGAGGGG